MLKRPLCTVAVCFLCIQMVLTGWLGWAKDLKPTPLESAIQKKEQVSLEGTVYRREQKPEYKIIYLKNNTVRLNNQIYQESNILVYVKTKNHISIGNKIRLSGQANTFQSARNPGNFDQKFYYQKQGIHVSVWAETYSFIEEKESALLEKLAALRIKWKSLLIQSLGDYYGNCMSAILLGDKTELDGELKILYQTSGIGHILAISGLHMSFLGSGLYKLLRKMGLPFLIAGGCGIVFLSLYTLMIGCGVSSLRALTMFLVRMGADITGRDYDVPTSLTLAAAVVTAWQPLYIVDAGFLLSFGAIVGIVYVAPGLQACLPKQKKKFKIFDNLFASLGVNVTLLPIMLYFYFEFPPYSIVLNLLIIPLMALVLGGGIFGSILCLLWSGGGEMVLSVSKGILFFYERVCRISMELPGSRVVVGKPNKGGVIVYYIILLAFCVCIHVYNNKITNKYGIVKASGVLLLLGIILFSSCPAFSSGEEVQVTMVDVGQGDSFHIKGPSGKHYLIDGGSSDISAVGTYRIVPFLKAKGVSEVEAVFISHGDEDHINGVAEMLETQQYGILINKLILPSKEVWDESLEELAQKAEDNGAKVYTIQSGKSVKDEEMTLYCEFPSAKDDVESGNAASMVLSLQYRDMDVLFTGDVEGEGERLLSEQIDKKYDVLKVSHHGSKNSGIPIFLDGVSPRIAWISAGIDNRYGHPHKETIEKLNARDCRIYNTQTDGAVTLYTNGKKMQIETYLD